MYTCERKCPFNSNVSGKVFTGKSFDFKSMIFALNTQKYGHHREILIIKSSSKAKKRGTN